MATYRATLTVEIEREDGSKSVISETENHHGGGNPRFEPWETDRAIAAAKARLFAKLGDVEVPANG